MSNRIRRFRLEYDPHVRCCCSVEEHLSGEYVLFDDYMKLLQEAQKYQEIAQRYNRDLHAVENHLCRFSGCDLPAVMEHNNKGFCYDHLPAIAKGTRNEG